jgi:hypothetical protein
MKKIADLALSDVLAKWIDKQANEINKERSKMPFVNEFASDEDIRKYNLNEIWDMYHPLWKGDYYTGRQPDFTIDRQRNIFFMAIGGGGEEHQNRKKWLLWLDGQHIVIEVDLAEGSSPNISDVPFKRVWGLVGIYPQTRARVSRKEIVVILKEALTTYGLLGVYRQVPNTIVEFTF